MKTRARRNTIAAVATTVGVACWLVLSACSNNGEGERCQIDNVNDDCENGLVCLTKSQVNQGYNNSDRCCPPDRSTATHPACTQLQNPVAGDSSPPADTGPVATDSGSTDTGIDTGSDAASDADAGDPDASDAAQD
jgi:hypothetical protein